MKKISFLSMLAVNVIILSGCASQPTYSASTDGAIPSAHNPPGTAFEQAASHSTQPNGVPRATANMPGGGIVAKLDTPASLSLPVQYNKTNLDANRF